MLAFKLVLVVKKYKTRVGYLIVIVCSYWRLYHVRVYLDRYARHVIIAPTGNRPP
jgi:hypothetical protein